jgi:hypothetical protein
MHQELGLKLCTFSQAFQHKTQELIQKCINIFHKVFLVQDYHKNTTKLIRTNYESLWNFLKRFRHGGGGKSIRRVANSKKIPSEQKQQIIQSPSPIQGEKRVGST